MVMLNRLAMYMPSNSLGSLDMDEREILQVAVARIEEHQRHLLEKLSDLSVMLKDIDRRVIAVEEFKWKIIGIAIAVGALASVVTKVLISKL